MRRESGVVCPLKKKCFQESHADLLPGVVKLKSFTARGAAQSRKADAEESICDLKFQIENF